MLAVVGVAGSGPLGRAHASFRLCLASRQTLLGAVLRHPDYITYPPVGECPQTIWHNREGDGAVGTAPGARR